MSSAPQPGDPGDPEIRKAIRSVEKDTSGEIRVFISRHPCADPSKSARQEFVRLGMSRTPLRNAVLLYFAPASRTFALASDEGIQLRCGPVFETDVTEAAVPLLREGRTGEAILSAIQCAGGYLVRHFPRHAIDRNDLPNSVLRD